jgi:ribulose-phosphate 3-epimerase
MPIAWPEHPLHHPLVAPSLLASDFANLQHEVQWLNTSAADWLHCDVMDGRFVPNISFGLPVLEAIKRHATKPLDVHLMIVEPDNYLADFVRAGADVLTVHHEACPHLHRTLGAIRELGVRCGVVLNPHTPVDVLRDVLYLCDLVVLMSVNPGFGGQQFIPRTTHKVAELRRLIEAEGLQGRVMIEVDGGVSDKNAPELVHAGADVLVAGNSVFKAPDPAAAIEALRNLLTGAVRVT